MLALPGFSLKFSRCGYNGVGYPAILGNFTMQPAIHPSIGTCPIGGLGSLGHGGDSLLTLTRVRLMTWYTWRLLH